MARAGVARWGKTYSVPHEFRDFAARRTEFLRHLVVDFDVSLKIALMSAYAQGLQDAADVALTPRPPSPEKEQE